MFLFTTSPYVIPEGVFLIKMDIEENDTPGIRGHTASVLMHMLYITIETQPGFGFKMIFMIYWLG